MPKLLNFWPSNPVFFLRHQSRFFFWSTRKSAPTLLQFGWRLRTKTKKRKKNWKRCSRRSQFAYLRLHISNQHGTKVWPCKDDDDNPITEISRTGWEETIITCRCVTQKKSRRGTKEKIFLVFFFGQRTLFHSRAGRRGRGELIHEKYNIGSRMRRTRRVIVMHFCSASSW